MSEQSTTQANTKVCIVGPNVFLNRMLSGVIEQESGFPCVYQSNLGSNVYRKLSAKQLLLFDCFNNDLSSVEYQLGLGKGIKTMQSYAALFNVKPDERFEKESFFKGFRGIFYMSDPPELFSRGVKKIMEGERWYTRKVLARCAETARITGRPTGENMGNLSRREKEILLLIAEGKRNREIADELYISPHTVKSHAYNIFKKIEAPNRFQAALWAARNLFSL